MRPACLALLITLPLLAAPPARAETLRRAWFTQRIPWVHVASDNARVRVRPGEGDTVAVVVKHVVKAGGWRYGEYAAQVEAVQSGDSITIRATTGGGTVVIGAIDERFEIQLRVPSVSHLDLETGDGSVDVAGVNTDLQVRTTSGSVNVRRGRGAIDVRTTRGGAVRVREHGGTLQAATLAGGDIEASGRFDRLDVASSAGLEVDVWPGSRVLTPWSIARTTGTRPLSLRLPAGFSARLELEATEGRLAFALPGAHIDASDAHAVRARLGEGGPVVRVTNASGSVRIEPTRVPRDRRAAGDSTRAGER